jgi:hypothetical protein
VRTLVNLRFGDLEGDTLPYLVKDYQRKAFMGKYATIRSTEIGPFNPSNLRSNCRHALKPA